MRQWVIAGNMLPVSFADDAYSVVHDEKPVLATSEDQPVKFSCSACGHCCRSYTNTIFLDPLDLFLMSNSELVNQGGASPVSITRDFSSNSVRRVGYISTDIIFNNPLVGRTPQKAGFVPIRYLKATKDSQGNDVCGFAVPTERKAGKYCGSSASSTSSDSASGLQCGFGPSSMPTTCSLYPFGELWSVAAPSDAAAKKGGTRRGRRAATPEDVKSMAPDELQKLLNAPIASNRFYTLDAEGCEGVAEPRGDIALRPIRPTGPYSRDANYREIDGPELSAAALSEAAEAGTAESYMRRGMLSFRLEQSDWFRMLLCYVACQGYDGAFQVAVTEAQLQGVPIYTPLRLTIAEPVDAATAEAGGAAVGGGGKPEVKGDGKGMRTDPQGWFSPSLALSVVHDILHDICYDAGAVPYIQEHTAETGAESASMVLTPETFAEFSTEWFKHRNGIFDATMQVCSALNELMVSWLEDLDEAAKYCEFGEADETEEEEEMIPSKRATAAGARTRRRRGSDAGYETAGENAVFDPHAYGEAASLDSTAEDTPSRSGADPREYFQDALEMEDAVRRRAQRTKGAAAVQDRMVLRFIEMLDELGDQGLIAPHRYTQRK